LVYAIAEFSSDLSKSKRAIGEIGKKAVVQVQNRYSPPALSLC